MWVVFVIETIDVDALILTIEERLGIEALAAVIMNFYSDHIDEYDQMDNTHIGRYSYT